MKAVLLTSLAVVALTTPVLADQRTTPQERAKVYAAAKAGGCSGGVIEKDRDGRILYEIENARCGGGARHDVLLDGNFRILSIIPD